MLQVTIPYVEPGVTLPEDGEAFINIDINLVYAIVATAGPPQPPFDIEIETFEFVRVWTVYDMLTLGEADDYLDPNVGIVTPYDDYINNYIKTNKVDLHKKCLEHELTNPETMV